MTTNIADVNVLDGSWSADKPVIIIEAETAWEAVVKGEIEQLVRDGYTALTLSGKAVVYLEAERVPRMTDERLEELRAAIAWERETRHWTIPQWRAWSEEKAGEEEWPGAVADAQRGADEAVDALEAELVVVRERAAEALRKIAFNAESHHAGEEGKARALAVIARWARSPESIPEGVAVLAEQEKEQ